MPTYLILLIVFTLIATLFGFWKGGVGERFGAAVVLINMVVAFAITWLLPQLASTLQFANDGLAALALLAVTIRYGAPWMGGVMLFYAAQFSLHSYYLVTSRESDYLHALINNINFGGVIWCMIIGTAVAWRRRVRLARAAAAAAAPAAAA